MQLMIKEN